MCLPYASVPPCGVLPSVVAQFFRLLFEALFRLVQVENPRIVDLYIEKANHHSGENIMRRYTDELSSERKLMKDFSITVYQDCMLSLHGCYLRDEDLDNIGYGLEVNIVAKTSP